MRLVVALVQIVVILLAGSLLVPLSPVAWLWILLISIPGVMLMVSFGYVIAGIATNPQGGTALILIANFAMLIGGNVFIDPSDSPWRMAVASAMPISYLADLFRHAVNAKHLWGVWVDLTVVFASTLGFALIAMRTFRFDTRPQHQDGRPAIFARAKHS